MGNILGGGSSNSGGGGNGLGGYGFGPDLQCCDAVVDPISLLTTIGAIAGASVFLRQAVIDNNVMGMTRRKRSFEEQLKSIVDLSTYLNTYSTNYMVLENQVNISKGKVKPQLDFLGRLQ